MGSKLYFYHVLWHNLKIWIRLLLQYNRSIRGVARKCVMLKPNTFFQLKLLVFHNFFSERPGEIPYLKKSR